MELLSPREESPAQALERWMAQQGDGLLRLCFLILKDRALAEDALQEALLKAYRAHGQRQAQGNERAWLNRIVVNCCHDIRRKAWYQREEKVDWLSDLPDPSDPYDAADDTLTREVLSLPIKYREPVVLHYFQGMKVAEVAQILSLPENTVLTRLRRARIKLKDALKEWYADG